MVAFGSGSFWLWWPLVFGCFGIWRRCNWICLPQQHSLLGKKMRRTCLLLGKQMMRACLLLGKKMIWAFFVGQEDDLSVSLLAVGSGSFWLWRPLVLGAFGFGGLCFLALVLVAFGFGGLRFLVAYMWWVWWWCLRCSRLHLTSALLLDWRLTASQCTWRWWFVPVCITRSSTGDCAVRTCIWW